MSTVLIEIRRAKAADATLVAAAHDAAWRTSYRGIIPGPELEKLISRRGPGWWENAITKGSRVALLQFGVLSDELTRRNMDLFASEVMPHLRD